MLLMNSASTHVMWKPMLSLTLVFWPCRVAHWAAPGPVSADGLPPRTSSPGGTGHKSFGGSLPKRSEIVDCDPQQVRINDHPSKKHQIEPVHAREEKNPSEVRQYNHEDQRAHGGFAAALKFVTDPHPIERDGSDIEQQNSDPSP